MTDLRDCLDFSTGTAWLKGTSIRVVDVVAQYGAGRTPEQIAVTFAYPLPVGQVYAAIAYYLLNREEYEEAQRRADEEADRAYEAYWNNLPQAERDRQTAQTARLVALKERFTGPDGRLDLDGLKAHVAAERAAAQPAGSGA